MKLIPFLSFAGQAREAMAFYARALGGQVVSELSYGAMPPMEDMDGCAGMPAPDPTHIAHAQVEAGGAVLMGADAAGAAGGGGPAADATTINVQVDSEEEAERVFAALASGGQVQVPLMETFWARRWGCVLDRYGKSWMVNCMKPA